MATATGKRSRFTIVKQDVVNTVAGFLGDLPDKPKEELSLKQAVEQLRDLIRSAFAKGYTYDEVARMLTDQGIRISAFTLKSYVPSGKRQVTRGKARRGKSTAGAIAPQPTTKAPAKTASKAAKSRDIPAENTAVPDAPAKPKRGRAKAAAPASTPEETTPVRRGRKPKSGEATTAAKKMPRSPRSRK